MSISAAVAEIRAGIDQLNQGKATLLVAATNFDDARALVHQATHGTSRPEPAQAIAVLTTALQQLGEVIAQHDAAIQVLTAYVADIAAGSTTRAAQPPTPATTTRPRSPPTPQPRDRIEPLRRELPPPLVGQGTGRKTHGRWFVGNGAAQTLVSGDDDHADLARVYLAKIGQDRASIRYQVEVKLSALIRQRYELTGQTTNATLVINHEVCLGDLSCSVFLPRLLPPGCSVTVITPRGRQTFTGEPT